MGDVKNTIKKNVAKIYAEECSGEDSSVMYLDEKIYHKEEILDIVDQEIKFEKPSYFVFIDEQSGYNWGHRCRYYLFDASNGKLLKEIHGSFPPFFNKKTPETFKVFKTGLKNQKKI